MAVKDFVGRGWSFPFRFDSATGGVSKDKLTGVAHQFNRIQMALFQIFGVKRGEMFMRRGFGTNARDLIFQLDTFNVTQRLEYAAQLAFQDPKFGEKRAFVDRVRVTLDRTTGQAAVDLNVALRSSNVSGNMVLPYYVDANERASVERGLTA